MFYLKNGEENYIYLKLNGITQSGDTYDIFYEKKDTYEIGNFYNLLDTSLYYKRYSKLLIDLSIVTLTDGFYNFDITKNNSVLTEGLFYIYTGDNIGAINDDVFQDYDKFNSDNNGYTTY